MQSKLHEAGGGSAGGCGGGGGAGGGDGGGDGGGTGGMGGMGGGGDEGGGTGGTGGAAPPATVMSFTPHFALCEVTSAPITIIAVDDVIENVTSMSQTSSLKPPGGDGGGLLGQVGAHCQI